MDKSFEYNIASNYLNRARDLQSQILQMDLDIKFRKLSSRSSFKDINDSIQIHYLQNQKMSIISERDSNISSAITYAAEILIYEIDRQVSGIFSLGAMLINNIQSFLSIYDIKVNVSVIARTQLAELSFKLGLPSLTYIEIASTLDKLKRHLY